MKMIGNEFGCGEKSPNAWPSSLNASSNSYCCETFTCCGNLKAMCTSQFHIYALIHDLVSYRLLLEGALREKAFESFFEVFLVSHAWTSNQIELTRVICVCVLVLSLVMETG